MTFPESDRVIYQKNALVEVICQVKFPPILKISREPVEFQERIRDQFPLLEQRPAVEFPQNMPPELMKALSGNAGSITNFVSRDRVWTISLFREFLALSCSSYPRWEDFRAQFLRPFQALNEIYCPAFISRIGLRYRNEIDRMELGLDDVPWAELLQPQICGELADKHVGAHVEEAARELVVNLGDNKKVRLAHWLISASNRYCIDADFSIETEVGVGDVFSQLDDFNQESGRLIRWAITERLHRAMGPGPV